jgi:hypothetical protein
VFVAPVASHAGLWPPPKIDDEPLCGTSSAKKQKIKKKNQTFYEWKKKFPGAKKHKLFFLPWG